MEVATTKPELGAQSSATDEEIFTRVLGPDWPDCVRTYGLGPFSDKCLWRWIYAVTSTHLIQMQVQEQLNQHKVQMEMQVKEMMDAMFSQMQGSNIKGRRRRSNR